MSEATHGSGCTMKCWGAAAVIGAVVFLGMLGAGVASAAALIASGAIAVAIGILMTLVLCRPAERRRSAPPSEPMTDAEIAAAARVREAGATDGAAEQK